MRPLSLAIEGLTSFREPQEIDFSELDLFVITGSTGAGKSSILDAMTFALYGKVARVNSHELRDLISHGSADMRVRLDFQIDGACYRVARRMGKTRHEVSLERIVDGSSIAELDRGGTKAVNERLEEIVGLDFGAFTKAVLLPQGAFHEFLKGDKAERRRILTQLLELNRYERAGQAARREATRLEAVIGEREALIASNYQDATKERLSDLKTAAKAAAEQHRTLEQAREEGREIGKTVGEATHAIATLNGTTAELEEARGELERLAEAWPPLEAEGNAAEQALVQAQAALAGAEKEFERAQKRLAATVKRTGDSAQLARLEAAAVAFSREQQELDELEGALTAARAEAAALSETLQAADAEQALKKQAAEERTQARQQAESLQKLAAVIAECAERAEAVASIEEQLAPARKQAQAFGEQADQARKQLTHVQQEHAAVVLRTGLAPGDHCPVCASIIETVPETDHDSETLLARARDAAEQAEARAREAQEAAIGLEAQRRTAAEELRKARAALPKKTDVPSTEEAAVALAEAKGAVSAAEQAEAEALAALEQATEHLTDIKTKAATAAERVEGLASKRHGTKERLEAAESTLTEGFAGSLPRNIDSALARRREELSAAEQERDNANESLNGARQTRDDAQAESIAIAERVSGYDNELATARTAARIACDAIARGVEGETLPAIPEEAAERAEALAIWRECCVGHLAAANAAIGAKEKEVSTAAGKLERLAAKAGVTVTADEPAAIEAELEQAVTAAHGAVVAAEKDVETLKTRIEERKEMEKAITDDRRLRTLYNALARDLRADHFLAWVLEESMNQLADQASIELLRISDNRYSLVADSGNFDVIDHHNADERRSVATLSGGETFLASLSLALALAAGLRELAGTAAGRLDAIYIDEGFGALDPETLDVVVDALERLREGDRMVGVITHVPTLAERIPMGLLVEKNGNSSRILAR